jgi:primosomal protein N' (replication factor Y)
MPDYRAAERTFQLVAQVAGRAGRAQRPGQVVVQCYAPDHYALRAAAHHDYEAFYKEEIAIRQADGFPPFTRFMRLVFANEDEGACLKDMEEALARMKSRVAAHDEWKSSILMLEGSPAPLTRIRALWRYQILMKVYPALYGRAMEDALADISGQNPPFGSQVTLEIDPQNMI